MKTYLRILAYTKPYKKQVLLYAVFTLFSVLFGGLTFVMLQPLLELLFHPPASIVDHVPAFRFSVKYFTEYVQYVATEIGIANGKSMALLCVAMFVVGLNLMTNIFRVFANYMLGTIRTHTVQDIRNALYEKLTGVNVGYVDKGKKGDIVSRIMSDVSEVEHTVIVSFETIIRDPLNILYILILMFSFSWKLTLFIFLVLPVSAIVISSISKKLKHTARETQSIYGSLMSIVDETISGIRIIKAFSAEGYITSAFKKINKRYTLLTAKQWYRRAWVPVFSESAMVFTFGMVLWYGGLLVYSGELENASGFITYLGLFFLVSVPAKSLSSAFGNVSRGLASADRIFEVLDRDNKIKEAEFCKSLSVFESSILFENVSFAYEEELVLKNINLEIKKGKIYALVGHSGSGKSTLAELILRFYEPISGRILVDGTDIRQISFSDLYNMTAVVTQEPILFNDTIFNNISFGMKKLTLDDVKNAANAANASEFIEQLADGYNSNIGDRGNLLSGGQRQRLSIARAILKNPPILILDEATSALDTNSEKLVQDALYKLMTNRTCLVIAHRLSTIQEADEIIVLDKGRIAEKGTHQELLATDGKYASLYKLQQLEA